MYNKVLVLSALAPLFLCATGMSQQQIWHEADTNDGVTSVLYGVAFSEMTIATAIGDNGIILRTTNSGKDWHRISSGVYSDMRAIFFRNPQNGYIAADTYSGSGKFDAVLRTVDGGVTWTRGTVSIDYTVPYDLYFTTPDSGIMVGTSDGLNGFVAYTTNGGYSWLFASVQSNILKNRPIYSVSFFDNRIGVAVGEDGLVIRTEDAGLSWSVNVPRCIADGRQAHPTLVAASFFGRHLIVVGETVCHSTDFAKTWAASYIGANNAYGAFLVDENNFFVVGLGESIVRTHDGGASWTTEYSMPMSYNTLHDIAFSANAGIAVGDMGKILYAKNPLSVVEKRPENSEHFVLFPSYPNPFNPNTTVQFDLQYTATVSISVYNTLGNVVKVLMKDQKPPGIYFVTWDASDMNGDAVPSGVYFVRAQIGALLKTCKITLMQ